MGTPTNITIDLDEDEPSGEVLSSTETVINEDAGSNVADDIIDEDASADSKLPKRARPNANGSVTLPLFEKVTLTTRKDGKVRDRVFTELVFHRFRGADLRAIQATSDAKASIVTFSRSTRISEMVMDKLFDKMDGVDIADGGRIIETFLTSGPKTGR
ncbi:hypothetical protein [Agrobacterium tumefaciens]|uniref:hypothetical protein n=1 Tax=Agrobacterium tumefaciens TaxID=358 RepID=UPI00080FC198|nr:hypothetical protein [Agrobacterium tumefaciens]NSL22367.1 hypothetical protein [Agrobacterium tumefaciens]NTC57246.1 hypothetical protein [Agrobacterium tumefaciens]NTC62100.1 hypothetical protein [Agrobacterium tumefaciens]NTC65830.1 hypothetical protein [Agrobacterium tumefaciens]NTC74410.1 hypothetical protein [Agrobacterium tumefaciens]